MWAVSLHLLSPVQNEILLQALEKMRAAYNRFDVEPCHFSGIPEDLSSLDYIPYELPMPDDCSEGSIPFCLAWGNVLVNSFGFEWLAESEHDDARLFALWHHDPQVLIFPYPRLLEIVRSVGCQDSPAETLWFDTVHYVDRWFVVPDGWHPVLDAINCPETIGCPKPFTESCRRLVSADIEFFHSMSTYPYKWARTKEWGRLLDYTEDLWRAKRGP